MKRIYFLIIVSVLTLTSGGVFSQQISSPVSSQITTTDDNDQNTYQVKQINQKDKGLFSMNINYDNAGSLVFKGMMMRTIAENTFWVKNAAIVTNNNVTLIDFKNKLLVNGFPFISQVPAVNGYVVEMPSGSASSKNIIVAIAGENGEKISDDLVINIDDIK